MRRNWNQKGLKFKILSGYSTIFCIGLILGGLFIYFQVRKTISDNIHQELSSTNKTILMMVKTAGNTAVRNYLRAISEKTKENIEAIYNQYKLGSITEDEAKNNVRQLIFSQTIGSTGYISLINSKGVPVEHPNPDVKGRDDWVNHDFVKKMVSRKHGFLEYEWKNPGEENYRPKVCFMSYFAPWDWIISASTYTQELNQLINVNDFRNEILSIRFGKSGYPFVLDVNGNVIIHPNLQGNILNLTDSEGTYLATEMIKKKNGKILYTWKSPDDKNSREKIALFNYLPEYNWIVATSGYFDDFFQILDTIKNIIIIGCFLVLFSMLLSSLWLSKLITDPLKKLTDFAILASKDLTRRSKLDRPDEIGALSICLNKFMEKLESSNASLKFEIKKNLETTDALRKSEAKYKSILRYIDEGYFEIDKNGSFTFFNESFSLISGYSKNELLNKI